VGAVRRFPAANLNACDVAKANGHDALARWLWGLEDEEEEEEGGVGEGAETDDDDEDEAGGGAGASSKFSLPRRPSPAVHPRALDSLPVAEVVRRLRSGSLRRLLCPPASSSSASNSLVVSPPPPRQQQGANAHYNASNSDGGTRGRQYQQQQSGEVSRATTTTTSTTTRHVFLGSAVAVAALRRPWSLATHELWPRPTRRRAKFLLLVANRLSNRKVVCCGSSQTFPPLLQESISREHAGVVALVCSGGGSLGRIATSEPARPAKEDGVETEGVVSGLGMMPGAAAMGAIWVQYVLPAALDRASN